MFRHRKPKDSSNHLAPQFTLLRTDTNTAEYITPSTSAGDRPDPATDRRGSSASSVPLEKGLSSLLHLRSHSRNASSSSVNLPQDLPSISDGTGEKEDQEAEWEHRATLLARRSRVEGPQQVAPLEPNSGKGSRSISVSSSSEDENIQEAIRLHEAGELERSTSMFGKLADPKGQNIALAQVLYGLALRHGWGCSPNPTKAIAYLSAAAQNSADVEAQALKAGMKKGGAAKGELVLAIFELANCYRHGWGVSVDPVAAQQYYLTAANLGDTDAMNEVAWCYLEGFGCKKDKRAGHWRDEADQPRMVVRRSKILPSCRKHELGEFLVGLALYPEASANPHRRPLQTPGNCYRQLDCRLLDRLQLHKSVELMQCWLTFIGVRSRVLKEKYIPK
ncbi:MAG: hypothetical protein M1840_003882 [Geoglossum simile]|nr:MAG: hypothetical protein M1840_003882 [Geoglossum simile]